MEVQQRGGRAALDLAAEVPELDPDDVEDLDEAPDDEVETVEEKILDRATAARSIAELKVEIETLKKLESLALGVRRSGADTKWRGAGESARRNLLSGCHRRARREGG